MIKKIHRYLGIALSALVLLVSVTGVMLVWKREYLWVTIPQARELRAEQSVLAQAAANIESSHPSGQVIFTRFYAEGLSVHKVFLSDRRYAWHDQNGQHIQTWQSNERFEDWLLDLHHRLLLGNTIGLNAVGIGGLLLVFLLILGCVLWWPWRKRYRVNLVPNTGQRRHLLKSHGETGVTILLPVLMIVITGVILIYPSESRFLLRDGLSDPKPPKTLSLQWSELVGASNHERLVLEPPIDWPSVFSLAEQQFPNGTLHWLSHPRDDSPAFTIGVQDQGSASVMGNSSIRFNAQSDVVIKNHFDQSLSQQAFDYTYPLHTGKFPTWYRLILSATGLLTAWLSFLGVISFFKRKRV